MDESPQMTLSGVYAPTVNESETITDAQRIRSPQGRARSGQLDLADRVREPSSWGGSEILLIFVRSPSRELLNDRR
ncbi:MAG: hypothetical protein BGO16_13410 [Nitrobacter sp. 62-23]|nr:MAG: hypothetical protein BGO16_13410 [Nitrobacter sp. 62-23]